MNLFVTGCSHTEGTTLALDNDLNKAWPYALQKLLKADEMINLSMIGCSNDRLVRTAVETVSTFRDSFDMAVVQFTDPTRFEFPHTKDTNHFYQAIPKTYHSGDPVYQTHIDNTEEPIKNYILEYYDTNNQDVLSLIHSRFLTQILTLQNLFENHFIPYVFIVWYDLPRFTSEADKQLFSVIDKSRILNYHSGAGRCYSMDRIMQSNGFTLCNKIRKDGSKDKHYMEDGHAFIASLLHDFIKYEKAIPIPFINRRDIGPEAIHTYD